jgi:hypothetical protein
MLENNPQDENFFFSISELSSLPSSLPPLFLIYKKTTIKKKKPREKNIVFFRFYILVRIIENRLHTIINEEYVYYPTLMFNS